MYSIEQIIKGVRTPSILTSELNRLINRVRYNNACHNSGIEIFEQDWDNLIILDACRYDTFEARNPFLGRTDRVTSKGSTTAEFIRSNFAHRTLYDVVYVSANPWYLRLKDEIDTDVFRYVNVHSDAERDAANGLTTTPERVTERAEEVAVEHPDKRLIIHYLQPHQPFLGPFGRSKFDHRKDFIQTVQQSGVSQADVYRAYEENFDLVASEVETLLETLEGRTVITADHGELLGERQRPIPVSFYGHPEGVYVPALVDVPWHIIETGTRKETVPESPRRTSSDQEAVEDQLSALGYRV